MSQEPPQWSSAPGQQQPAFPAAGADQPGPVPVGMRYLAVVWNESTKAWEPASPIPLAGFGTGLSKAEVEALVAAAIAAQTSAWENIALTAKTESAPAENYPTFGVRTEDNKTVARLRGGIKIKEAQTGKTGETLFTIPAGFRPLTNIRLFVLSLFGAEITTKNLELGSNGIGRLASGELVAGSLLILEGVTYPQT